MHRIAFAVNLGVIDRSGVEAFASDIESVDWPDALGTAACNPERAPLDTGYEIVDKRVMAKGGSAHVLFLRCDVHDPVAVVEEARSRYAACWSDESWRPATLDEALYEILVASNASPSPDDVGFEIRDVIYSASPTPAPDAEGLPTP